MGLTICFLQRGENRLAVPCARPPRGACDPGCAASREKPSRAQLSQKRVGHRLCPPPTPPSPAPPAAIMLSFMRPKGLRHQARRGVAYQSQHRDPDPGGEFTWRGARRCSKALFSGIQQRGTCWLLGHGLSAAGRAGPHPALSSARDRVLGAPPPAGVADHWHSGLGSAAQTDSTERFEVNTGTSCGRRG